MSPKQKPLACGGRGPCCHIGYAHRHCEHCDMVIDTRSAGWWLWPYYQPSPPVYQPTYWWNNPLGQSQAVGFGGQHSAMGSASAAVGNLFAQNDNEHLSYSLSPALPTPDHACEVN